MLLGVTCGCIIDSGRSEKPKGGYSKMKEKHLKRTAKLLLIIYAITTLFSVVGMVAQLTYEASLSPIRSIIPLATSALTFIVGLIVYIVSKDNKIVFIRYVGCAFSLVYFLMLIMGKTGNAFPYMLPIAVVILYSLDKTAIVVPCVAFVITNIIRIVLTIIGSADINADLEMIMVEAIITILFTITAARGMKVLKDFFQNSIEEVTEVADRNESVAKKIVEVADSVGNHTDSMKEALNTVLEQTDSVNEAMNSIVFSTSETAEAIQNQTIQTKEIQDVIDGTHESTQAIVSITEDTKVSLSEGTTAINELFGQVDQAMDGNRKMEVAATALQEKTDAVKGITDIIFGISSQTNLLALNASIEAARAGEAGRGFAVVAEEIRNLAEQTRLETENITSLIEQLAENAKEVIERVAANVEASKTEYKCAQLASEKFDEITDKINSLAAEVNDIGDKVTVLRTSNNQIVDNVNSISATSEEVSASTQIAYDMSDNNKRMLHEFAETMKKLAEEIEGLRNQ